MPHSARKRSESGFYHVVTKGDGGQIIFEGDSDRRRYLSTLEEALGGFDIAIHAYCLMSNHVHLLLGDNVEKPGVSEFMKHLNERYASYFNRRTGKVGHLFNGRFWSEPVENDEYFLAALRYIHANPEPAGICRARDYPWSSYGAYVGAKTFVSTDLALSLLGGAEEFEAFHRQAGLYVRPFKTSALANHLSADELANVALRLLGRETLNAMKRMQPKERRVHVRSLAGAGFTVAEIARVTGVGRQSIRKDLMM